MDLTPLLAAAVIGLLALDTGIAFQVMIAQPLFSCTILGLILGDVITGAEIGCMMQLLWLNTIPAGAIRFPEGNIGSMVGCAFYLLNAAHLSPNLLMLSTLLIVLGVSQLGIILTSVTRKINVRYYDYMVGSSGNGWLFKVGSWQILAGVTYWLAVFVLASVVLFAGFWGAAVANSLSPLLEAHLSFVKPMIWGLGLALIAHLLWTNFKTVN